MSEKIEKIKPFLIVILGFLVSMALALLHKISRAHFGNIIPSALDVVVLVLILVPFGWSVLNLHRKLRRKKEA